MTVYNSAKAVLTIGVVLAVVAVPVHVEWKSGTLALTLASADAKNGNGGGHGGGSGGKGGSDSRGGKGSDSKSSKERNGATGKAKGRPASVAKKEVTPNSVSVRYRNGYLEQVVKGRFIMKDSKGRTIVNRKATAQDRMRLLLKAIVP
ncbi:hypothetical protein [Shinella zoogloeoides]|uniref:hypothetical protein n=1 Tax=Shinella zoogloeoides TaxID=352475 RepID=UPI00273D2F79|nr:hypothetical protein [Shinella zoogloeoides]WLR95328.1 hypothetical protein Q9316_24310 [Shinella zoogloeoides]